jgi:hypothetical protein
MCIATAPTRRRPQPPRATAPTRRRPHAAAALTRRRPRAAAPAPTPPPRATQLCYPSRRRWPRNNSPVAMKELAGSSSVPPSSHLPGLTLWRSRLRARASSLRHHHGVRRAYTADNPSWALPGSDLRSPAREPARVSPSFCKARAEPGFLARHANEPDRAEPKKDEPKRSSHRGWTESARVQPYSQAPPCSSRGGRRRARGRGGAACRAQAGAEEVARSWSRLLGSSSAVGLHLSIALLRPPSQAAGKREPIG